MRETFLVALTRPSAILSRWERVWEKAAALVRCLRLIVCAAAAAVAPAFSAIGLLVGPLAALRIGLAQELCAHTPQAHRLVLVPIAGTFAFLAVASVFRYREVVESSIRQNADLPTDSVPSPWQSSRALPPVCWRAAAADCICRELAACAVCAGNRHGVLGITPQCGLIIVGLAAIGGGYLLAYSTRSGMIAKGKIIDIQRHHLFPHFGFALLVSAAAWTRLRCLDARPRTGLKVATAPRRHSVRSSCAPNDRPRSARTTFPSRSRRWSHSSIWKPSSGRHERIRT